MSARVVAQQADAADRCGPGIRGRQFDGGVPGGGVRRHPVQAYDTTTDLADWPVAAAVRVSEPPFPCTASPGGMAAR